MQQPGEFQQQMEELALQKRMGEIGQKILVLSGKGGVGKSTVAANIACALAAEGKRVGLLDVDVHGPSVPQLMGLTGQRLTGDGTDLLPISVSENLKVISVGFMLQSAKDPVIWRGPAKYHMIRQFLKDVAWGELDYLIVDCPPGTGDEPLAVAQLSGKGSKAVIVTTPQDLAIADVRRSVSFCGAVSLPVAGIIENMSGFVCPDCGKTIDLFKTGGGEKLATEMGIPFLGRIPFDPQVVTAGDAGTPFVTSLAGSATAKVFAQTIQPLMAKNKQSSEGVKQMRIAIPMAEGKLCMHFGHCEVFALVDVDAGTKTIVKVTSEVPPPHEPGLLPRWLGEKGANVIIAGGMGQRAQQLFVENGVKVVVGAPADTAENLVTAYLNSTLEMGENVCDH
jgi:Mrp family chromosome partitioning ATPase/predicted Fe-Mo cluster-binding NifX family protein